MCVCVCVCVCVCACVRVRVCITSHIYSGIVVHRTRHNCFAHVVGAEWSAGIVHPLGLGYASTVTLYYSAVHTAVCSVG